MALVTNIFLMHYFVSKVSSILLLESVGFKYMA